MLSCKADINAYPDLWEQYRATGSIEIRNKLVTKYEHLVKISAAKIVANYKYYNFLDDIINEGIIALIDAVEKYDVTRNVKFETYASIKIRGAMIDYIRKQDCMPRRVKTIAKKINEASHYLCNKLGRMPDDDELSEYLQISKEKFEKLQVETHFLNVLFFEQTLEEQVSESDKIKPINYGSIETPEQYIFEKELLETLSKCVDKLNEKEKMVLSLYYKEQLKIKEIAEVLNVSDSRVSQIHSSALRKLNIEMKKYMG